MLASAPLKPGFDRARLSRYGDPVWDLEPAVFRENARRCHCNVRFGGIDDPALVRTLKAYLYARLNFDVPGQRVRLAPSAIRQEFNKTRRFLAFLISAAGACDLALADQPLLDAYRVHLQSDPGRTAVQVAALLDVIVGLHLYGEHMPGGGVTFPPWRGRPAPVVAGGPRQQPENLTPRIPEAIIGSLLGWSLKYVAVFAPDVLAARAELQALEARRAVWMAEDAALPSAERCSRRLARLHAHLAERRRQGRGVPVWSTPRNKARRFDGETGLPISPVNCQLLHLHAGVNAGAEPAAHLLLRPNTRADVEAAVATLGVEIGGMDTPITTDPDTGQPWRQRFDAASLAHEERMLQAACYVLCAYLTGMRDSEVQAMQVGCLRVTRSEDGLVQRHRVRSRVYKARGAEGNIETWVTIEPVAQAVAVLEDLTEPVRRQRGGTSLWRVLHERNRLKEHVGAEIVRTLNTFRDHLNAVFGTAAAPAVPNGQDGRPWRFTTRQFRRTVAWHIANRPFGTVAGKLQYKHTSVAAFEGYAGTSSSGFRQEVERERVLGQLDDVLTYFERRQRGVGPTGPAGPRIARELDHAAAELNPLPGHVADAARLRTMLASLARTLHPGILSDCFFDPNTALCLRSAERIGVKGPVTALCEPTRCPNSCMTSRHRPAWAGALGDVEILLRTKRLSGHQRVALQGEAKRFRRVLDGIPAEA